MAVRGLLHRGLPSLWGAYQRQPTLWPALASARPVFRIGSRRSIRRPEAHLTLTPAHESSQTTVRSVPRPASRATWPVLVCYLAAAVLLTWKLWRDPTGRMPTGDSGDVDVFAWFLRYSATAVSHGKLPALVTTAMNAPQGVNLMWNASFLLPGVVLTPLTLLAGPQVSLTVALTLGYAGSAATLFIVLRRWGAGTTAAALGGALYGFSPALVVSAPGHNNLQFALLPPLMIHELARIITGRGSPVRAGIWLGLLAAAQLFTGEELLVDTAIVGVLVVAVVALSRPRQVVGRLRGTSIGLATAAGVAAVLSGYAVWVQFAGPLHQSGIPWNVNKFVSRPYELVTPSKALLLHASGSAVGASRFLGMEYLGYLGWPLLVVVTAAGIWYWKDLRVRTAAVTFALLEWCSLGSKSLGSYPGVLLPWHWLGGMPLLRNLLPDRFAIFAAGAAGAALAFALDSAVQGSHGLVRVRAWRWRQWAAIAIVTAALVPLIPTPLSTQPVVSVPRGWRATFAWLKLPARASALVMPIPDTVAETRALRWQAETGVPAVLAGGYFMGPNAHGQATSSRHLMPPVVKHIDALLSGGHLGNPLARGTVSALLKAWDPAAVVLVAFPQSAAVAKVLTEVIRHRPRRFGDVLVWRYHPSGVLR